MRICVSFLFKNINHLICVSFCKLSAGSFPSVSHREPPREDGTSPLGAMFVVVASCVPAAFCLRPSSCFARGVGTIAMQPERSAEMLATSIHVWPRSRVSMLDKPVLEQLGSPLSMSSGVETSRSPLLERLEAMEGFWYSDDFYGPHGREWVEV